MYEALLVRVGFKFWECSWWNIFFQHPTPDTIHERVVWWKCVRMVILVSCSEGRYGGNKNMWYNILRSIVEDRRTVRMIVSCVLICFVIFSSAQKSVVFINGQTVTALVIILPRYRHISFIVSSAMMWYDMIWCDVISFCRHTLHALPFHSTLFPYLTYRKEADKLPDFFSISACEIFQKILMRFVDFIPLSVGAWCGD